MKLNDWEMNVFDDEGVQHVGLEDVIVYESEAMTEILLPKPVIVRPGGLIAVTASFDMGDCDCPCHATIQPGLIPCPHCD